MFPMAALGLVKRDLGWMTTIFVYGINISIMVINNCCMCGKMSKLDKNSFRKVRIVSRDG